MTGNEKTPTQILIHMMDLIGNDVILTDEDVADYLRVRTEDARLLMKGDDFPRIPLFDSDTYRVSNMAFHLYLLRHYSDPIY